MSRFLYLDIIKIIAIIMVVMCHLPLINSVDLLREDIGAFWCVDLCFGTLGVPLFMMATGALVLNKKFDNKEAILHFYKNNFLSIYITGVLWCVIYYILNNIDKLDVIVFLKTILLINKPEVHLWYIRMILMYYALIPLLSYLCHKKRTLFIMVVVSAFLVNFCWIGYDILVCRNHIPTHSGLSMSCYMVYLAIGYWIENKKWNISSCFSTILFVIGVFSIIYLRQEDYFRFFWYDNPFVLMASVGLFSLVKNTSIKSVKSRYFEELSKMTFGVYLCHMLFLYIVGKRLLALIDNDIYAYLMVWLVTLFLSNVLVFVCRSKTAMSKIFFRC